MMEYDHQCKMDPTMPLKYPCTRSSTHLATLVIINLCPVMMSQSGDITSKLLILPKRITISPRILVINELNRDLLFFSTVNNFESLFV
jgi:hypothetical protein